MITAQQQHTSAADEASQVLQKLLHTEQYSQ